MTREELVQLIDKISMTRHELQRAFHEVEVFKEVVDYHRSEVDRSLKELTVSKEHADRDMALALDKLHQLLHEQGN